MWASAVKEATPASAAVVTFLVLAAVFNHSGQVEVLALGISEVSSPPVYAFAAAFVGVVDAAIAANAVLCVVYPHMAGLGGDAFFLVHPRGGDVEAINASGPAAAGATRDLLAEQGHEEAIPQTGVLSVLTVPGAVDGWQYCQQAVEHNAKHCWGFTMTTADFADPRHL